MKTNLSVLLLALVLAGCASLEQTAYRTIGATVYSVDAAMHGWGDYVRAGKATTEDQAAVKAAYERYQWSMAVVESAVLAYKNAPAGEAQLETALRALEEAKAHLINLIYGFTLREKL